MEADPVRKSTVRVALTNGPRGLHCFANPSSKGGHATSGECIKGTIAFPTTGFAWFTT